jgi:GNAT superfamily N-acetyltransferase
MIRPAKPEDVAEIHAMVRELADYEKSLDQAKATPQQLHDALFGERAAAFAHIAEDEQGHVVGFALWFLNFSTWTGVHGIYLEDLYVRPGARHRARKGPAGAARPDLRRARLSAVGMVGARLE